MHQCQPATAAFPFASSFNLVSPSPAWACSLWRPPKWIVAFHDALPTSLKICTSHPLPLGSLVDFRLPLFAQTIVQYDMCPPKFQDPCVCFIDHVKSSENAGPRALVLL